MFLHCVETDIPLMKLFYQNLFGIKNYLLEIINMIHSKIFFILRKNSNSIVNPIPI